MQGTELRFRKTIKECLGVLEEQIVEQKAGVEVNENQCSTGALGT